MLDEIDDALTPAKAAQLLGVHIGTIHRWMMSGVRGRILPSILVGGRRKILVPQLKAFLSVDSATRGEANKKEDETANRKRDADSQLRSFGVRISKDQQKST